MTAHAHSTLVPSCFRCDLGSDEARASQIDQMREAATLMRQRASQLIDHDCQGPWVVKSGAVVREERTCNVALLREAFPGFSPTSLPLVLDHVASWSPEIALMVANLLDYEANIAEFSRPQQSIEPIPLAVARMYLGED